MEQGRRQTLQQAKPGLVVVGLEEVPPVGGAEDAGYVYTPIYVKCPRHRCMLCIFV